MRGSLSWQMYETGYSVLSLYPKGVLISIYASCGLEWRERYRIIRGICEGLCYLHEKRILHLDLKPANVLLDIGMVPKIADFGLSRCFDEGQTRAITQHLCGSQGYLAPEFYRGQIAFASDIYSLGVIIMEMLTGAKGYFEEEHEMGTGRRLGAGTRHRGLWYMDRQGDVKTAGMALA
uniref:non-specific serine/threonine protein kinase n=1 Tax=Aegilops tauschii subsp. strangulata TaxID=200361 RepID=A0A452YR93_AEGTS